MNRFIKADLYKVKKTLSLYIMFLISTVTATITLVIMNQIANGEMTPDMGVNISLISDTMLAGIFGGIIIGELVIDDFVTKFVHNKVMSGNGRKTIILSKLVSFIISFSIILLPYIIVVIVAATCGENYAPLAGIPSPFFDLIAGYLNQTDSGIIKCILLCIVILLVYIARLSICIPFAFKIKKKIPVLVIGFATAFVFDILFSLVKDIDVIANIIKLLPYYRMTQISIDISSTDIIGTLLSAVVFTVAMIGVTYLLFKKDEIK